MIGGKAVLLQAPPYPKNKRHVTQKNKRLILGGMPVGDAYTRSMLFELPDHKTLYEALINRDPAYDGQAFVCVASTGVFCRLTCPARKPKAENCTFYATVSECIEAGFRDCKRCHPLRPMANSDPTVASLIAALEERPHFRWRESDLERLGYDLSTVRRSFKRQFGMTFLEMARQRRLQHGFQAIARGERVVDAQLSAGFDSPSAFRTAFTKLIGKAPGHLSSRPLLFADWIRTPLGDMVAVTSKTHLHLLEFFDRPALPRELAKLERNTKGYIGVGPTAPSEQIKRELDDFFAGKCAHFNTPLAYHGSEFSREVWDALRTIPPGHTRSYSSLAKSLGRPKAVRAVARANGANQLALVVPCHRVIGADGSLTGYGGGLWRKQKLLEVERQYAVADQRKAVV